jgi:tetratricopeptide (TPR) repeat protein
MSNQRGERILVAAIIMLLAGVGFLPAQQTPPAPAAPASQKAESASTAEKATAAAPDHAESYYHYMLARRYRELAGIYNRPEFVQRAISEYKLAMAADPGSLFLRVELAELYWRVGQVGDAVQEVQGVLKVNPKDVEAHKLLGNIYLRTMGQPQQADQGAKENLQKAIQQFKIVSELDPSDTDSAVVLGRLYKLNNQDDKAAATFQKVLGAHPNSRQALVSLAQLYVDQGEYDKAIAVLTQFPSDEMGAPLLGMLGYAYGQAGQTDQAVATFKKGLELEPDNEDLRRSYSDVLMAAGKPDAAREQLKKILALDPQDGPTYLRLGQLDRTTGKFDEARQELAKARDLMPDNQEVPYQQALLEDAVGNEAKAIAIVEQLLKDSEQPDGHYSAGQANNRAIFLERLGLIYRSEEKYDKALDAFREILKLGPDQASRAEARIIETLRLAHHPGQAMAQANEAVKKYPKDHSLLMLRASLLGEQGHVDEAVQQLQTLLTGTPDDRDVELVIAQVYSQAKRYPDAQAAAEKALALSPHPQDQVSVHYTLGSIYEREKKYDLAEQEFKKVLATDPLNGAAANYLGYMLADRGVRLEESVKYIKVALETDPNNGAYLDSLGWAYYKLNRLDLAAENLEKAVRLISDDPTIHEHLGHVYLSMGKMREAEQQWERALQDAPKALSSDFTPAQAAKLRKELEALKHRLAKQNKAALP